jgi:hypothetical protein
MTAQAVSEKKRIAEHQNAFAGQHAASGTCQARGDDVDELATHLILAEVLGDALTVAASKVPPERCVSRQAEETFRKLWRIAGRCEDRLRAWAKRFSNAADVRARYRKPGRHALEHAIRQPLRPRAEDADVCCRKQRRDIIDVAKEADGRTKIEIECERLQRFMPAVEASGQQQH